MTLTDHLLLDMKAGANDLQRAVERYEGASLMMMCVPTSIARAALEYIKHLGRLTGALQVEVDQLRASRAQRTDNSESCVCGDSSTLGSVHRTDGPCYVAEAAPALPVAQQDERAMFEAAYVAKYPTVLHIMPGKFDLDEDGNYSDGAVYVAWDMWQARAALSSKRQDAPQEAVPVEHSEILDRQVAEWRNEVARLEDLIATATGGMVGQDAQWQKDEPPRDVKMGEAFKEVGGWMNGGELGYPTFGSMNALWAYTVKMIRSYAENKACRELAAPSVPAGGSIDTPELSELVVQIKRYPMLSGPMDDLIAHVATKVQAARDEALNEAAKICEYVVDPKRPNTTSAYSVFHADRIRELRSPAATEDKGEQQ